LTVIDSCCSKIGARTGGKRGESAAEP
jgi:hypothetical protein